MKVWKPKEGLPGGYDVVEVPLRSFFRAIHGFGLSHGAPASYKRAVELLTAKKIVEVKGEPIGKPERVILRELVLEDGTRLHFEASTRGACLYYIEEKSPSCVEVFDGSPDDVEAATPGLIEVREETRRAIEVVNQVSGPVDTGTTPPPTSATKLPDPGGMPIVPEGYCLHPNEPASGERTDSSDFSETVRVRTAD
jgi:hypothetical protein